MGEEKKTQQIKQMMEETVVKNNDAFTMLKEELDGGRKYYSEKNSTVKVKSVFSREGFFFPDDEKIYKLKHDYIVEIIGLSIEKKDTDFQTYLKEITKKFDEKLNGNVNESLFLNVVSSYPELLSKTDLKWMVDNVKGKKERFVSLCNFLLCYINPEKEPNVIAKDAITSVDVQKRFNFIWEIFKAIKFYGEEWAEIGETYLDSLFSDDYVAFNIFTKQFFKKRRVKTFIKEVKKYCNKYLKGGKFDLYNSEIYDHYSQQKRVEKKRNILLGLTSLVVVIGIGVGSVVFLNSVNKNTIEFHGNLNEVFIYTYNEEPNFDGLYVTYKKYNGTEMREDVTFKMIEGINENEIGKQQSVSIAFKGKKYDGLQVRIDASKLNAPTIMRQLSNVSWQQVNNATGYEIYVEDHQITQPTGNPKGTVSGTVKTFDFADYCKSGQYSYVYVRAIFTDGDSDVSNNLYVNSVLSNEIKVKKLPQVSNVVLKDNTLSWDNIEGVDGYRIQFGSINEELNTTSFVFEFVGGEEVTISTNNKNEEELNASETFTVLKPVTNITYEENKIKWESEKSVNNYQVILSKDGEDTPTSTISSNSIDVSGYDKGVYKITVCAYGSDKAKTITSPKTESYFAIGSTTILKKQSNVVSISCEDDIGKEYKIVIGNKVVAENLSENKYEIQDGDFAEAGKYQVSIIATKEIGGEDREIYLKSTFVTKLKEPELTYNQVKKEFNHISAQSGQTVKYVVEHGGVEEYTLPTDFNEGEYKIGAYIETENENELNSNKSEITIYKLPAPQIKVDYTTNFLAPLTKNQNGVEIAGDVKITYYYGTSVITNFDFVIPNVDGYKVKGILSADSYKDCDYVLTSEYGEEITVNRYITPVISYNNGNEIVVEGISQEYLFYYKETGESDSNYKPLQDGKVNGLSAGNYTVYAVKKGAYDTGNGVYYINTDSNPIEISKANIDFEVKYIDDEKKPYIMLTFGEKSDTEEFSYKVSYYNGDTLLGEYSSVKTDNIPTGNIFTFNKHGEIDKSLLTKIVVEITMNGVSVSNTWEKN